MIRATFRTRPTRILTFDLENRPLAYWYDGETTSEITAFGWKWSDEKAVHTMLLHQDGLFSVSDGESVSAPPEGGLSDRPAYTLFVNLLASADLVVGHNIRRHDLPMLNAALIRRQMDPLPELRTVDTCRDLPSRRGLSYSLENLVEMYGIKGKKYGMSQPAWEQANRLTADGMELARKRVSSDVVLQERLYRRLRDLGLLKPPRVWRG